MCLIVGPLGTLSGKLWEARMELGRNDSQPWATYGIGLLVSGKTFKWNLLLTSPLRIEKIEDENFRACCLVTTLHEFRAVFLSSVIGAWVHHRLTGGNLVFSFFGITTVSPFPAPPPTGRKQGPHYMHLCIVARMVFYT